MTQIENVIESIKSQHQIISQLSDYISILVDEITEKQLIDKEKLNKKFTEMFLGTYQIGGEITITKYNLENETD